MDDKNFVGLQDQTRETHFFLLSQIFKHSDNGQTVPNKGDIVVDTARGFYIVTSVDYTTGISVLSPWTPVSSINSSSDDTLLLATGPGSVNEAFRLFVDKSVTPHVAAPDRRLPIYGSDIAYYKIFIGSEFASNSRAITFIRDTNGTTLGENIPFEAIQVEHNQELITRWAPTVCYTTENLVDGERCTLVAYTKEGGPVSTATLVVKNTGAVRQLSSARRYVNGIGISSPFIPATNPEVIEVPVNVPIEQIPMTGLVYYTDGRVEEHALDNVRMSLFGMDNYTATRADEGFKLVLTYPLADGEVSYQQKPTADRKVTKLYRARTIEADGSYTVKLYVYPNWNMTKGQYELEYWLYNIDRQTGYNVTPYIELGSSSNAFNPELYGTLQTITVAVDLNRISSQFKAYRHVQTFQIVLMARGSENKSNCAVRFRPDQSTTYGVDEEAKLHQLNTNSWELDIKCKAESKEDWLKRTYWNTEPLYSTTAELRAPTPTHFRVVMLHNSYEYSVDQWSNTFNVINDLTQGQLLYLEWILRTDDTDLQLGRSALPVHIV